MRLLVSMYALLQGGGSLGAVAPLYAIWAVGGWCGTRSPGIVVHPKHPDPEPWWRAKLIGVVAGVVGGWVFTHMFSDPTQPVPWTLAVPVAASVIGAVVASRFVSDLYLIARGAGQAQG